MSQKNTSNRSFLFCLILIVVSPVAVGLDVNHLSDGMQVYFGSLHGHSNFSDGDEAPSEVLTHARDVAQFDFYGLTDHGEFLFGSEWDSNQALTDGMTEDHEFVAFRGFEYSHSTDGHINVFYGLRQRKANRIIPNFDFN